jgi:hypothetical protein
LISLARGGLDAMERKVVVVVVVVVIEVAVGEVESFKVG